MNINTPPNPPHSRRGLSGLPIGRIKRAVWPGAVWIVPCAALLIVGYLGLRAIVYQGFDVVVTFPSAAGAQTGDTKVIYRGIEVGQVTKIRLNRDAHRVDITLHLVSSLKSSIGSSSKFWLVGANPTLSDFNSIKAAVSGLYVGIEPGGGAKTRRFTGLDQAPIIPLNVPGRSFWLDMSVLSAVKRGSTLMYHGAEAGLVADIEPIDARHFRAKIFVHAPFDRFVTAGSLFWTLNPVQFSLSGGAVTGQLASPAVALNGGVAFDTPGPGVNEPAAPADTHFQLYTSEAGAQQGPDGDPVLYRTTFAGAAGALEPGAPVLLKGSRIGVVEEVGLNFDPDSGAISNPVTFAIYPRRLHMTGGAAATIDGRTEADRAMRSLAQHGFRATVGQDPPVLGARNLNLEKITQGGTLAFGEGYPIFPAAAGDAGGSISDKADALMTKLNEIPYAAIGENVRNVTHRLQTLMDSPKIDDSISHLDSTLTSLDQMTSEMKPRMGPLIDKLDATADQLNQTAGAANDLMRGSGNDPDASLPAAIHQVTEAARAVRSLADYLERHPEAVLKGKPAQ